MDNELEQNTQKDDRSDEQIETEIINLFKNDTEDKWRTLDQIASSCKSNSEKILKLVSNSPKFAITYNILGQPLVTTRERFRKEEPFLQKLIGAFKNRIK